MSKIITVTVPKDYSFIVSVGDEEEEGVTGDHVSLSPSGDFLVTGEEDNVLSYVEGITIDDYDSIDPIMATSVDEDGNKIALTLPDKYYD